MQTLISLKIICILLFFFFLHLFCVYFFLSLNIFNSVYILFINLRQYFFFTSMRDLVQTQFYDIFFPYIVEYFPEKLLFLFKIEYILYLCVLVYLFYNLIGIFFLRITLAYPRKFLLKISSFRCTMRKILLRFLRFLWWYFSFRAGFFFVKLYFMPLFELLFFF